MAFHDPLHGFDRGEQFAGFIIIQWLGASAMGEVYLAEHPRLPRRQAFKILPIAVSSDPNIGSGSTGKLNWRRRCGIRTSSGSMIAGITTASCGSRWTMSKELTQPSC